MYSDRFDLADLRSMVVPVVDLQSGVVVHGREGKRMEYRTVRGTHGLEPTPSAIGGWFSSQGFRTVYVADLDAIEGKRYQWSCYEALVRRGLALWIDAGIVDATHALEFVSSLESRSIPARVVVGLESVRSSDCLPEIHAALVSSGTDFSPLFSLDLCRGCPIAAASADRHAPLEWVDAAVAAGFTELIVLDLAHVGTGLGPPSLPLCGQIARRYPDLSIILGGGIRNWDDVRRARSAGCVRVLVATALHSGGLQ